MNNEQIPESVIAEWENAARNKVLPMYDLDIYIEGCKSQYHFREKNKVLRDALEQIAFNETLFSHEPKEIAQQALKQTQL